MIEYISGSIAELTPTYVIVDNHGIGYEMNISLTTFSELENKKEVRLLAHEVIREDAHVLFGFATARERALFRLLIGVSGVGATTAERVIVDLRDKIKPAGDTLVLEQTPASEAFDEALAALTMLGFAKPQSQKVLTKLFVDDPSLKVEKAIKKALTML